MNRQYDLIIVGSGLYGATVAFCAKQQGKRCLVLERRAHIGGNIRDEWIEGINVHLHGAHIFHTDNEDVWKFVNRFSDFAPYTHTVIARNEDKIYHLPFNLNTFYDVYGVTKPEEIDMVLATEHQKEFYPNPNNLEEKAINLVGRRIYDLLIKGYTEKQWGQKANELSADVITRLPVRDTFDNRYFCDRYQGIPKQGYSKMIEKMLDGVEVRTNIDFCNNREYWISISGSILYTGMIDELMEFKFGELTYRSLKFDTEIKDIANYQGIAVINETNVNIDYTRTIEHKHFDYENISDYTIITKEFPQQWKRGLEPYYPVNNLINDELHLKYIDLIRYTYPNIIVGGRLGHYKYYDMDDIIIQAFKDIEMTIK